MKLPKAPLDSWALIMFIKLRKFDAKPHESILKLIWTRIINLMNYDIGLESNSEHNATHSRRDINGD